MKKISLSPIVFLILTAFAAVITILNLDKGKTASAQDLPGQWTAAILLSPEQLQYAQQSKELMGSSLQSNGVARNLNENSLELSGSVDVAQLRKALFDEATPFVDFLSGPVDLTLALPASSEPVTLQLEARVTAGYRWEVLPNLQAAYTQKGESTFMTRYRGYGAPSIQTIKLQSNGSGGQVVHLVYKRSFEKNSAMHARVYINMSPTNGVIEISDPTPKGLPISSEMVNQGSSVFDPLSEIQAVSLPTAWDWRNSGIVPDVRDQGACGSCWAFGTVAVMESAIKKAGGALTDLSEQFLISCNNDGWDCNGGLTASMYHTDTLGKSQTAAGGVLESIKPYTASKGSCSVVLPHAYKASSWQFIVADEFTMPTVDQIKAAIYTYGPITAGVCAGSGWDTYTSGVFSTDETSQCGGSTNHQIVLVGWEDATQSWILRNSWGSGWGIGGYMKIKWGTSRVGEGTSWILYSGSILTPTATLPATVTRTTTPTSVLPATLTRTAIPTSTRASTATRTPAASSTLPATVTRTAVPTSTGVSSATAVFTATATPTTFPTQALTQTPTASALVNFAPSGDTYSVNPTYSWSMISSTVSYRLRVKDLFTGAYIIDGALISNVYCNISTNRCSTTPATMLTINRSYQWQVAAGSGGYNSLKTFRIVPGFNSQFNGNASGWLNRPGGTWRNTTSSYYTNGTAYMVSSTSYNQTFTNFTYQARMKRVGSSGFSSGLIVRGIPTFDPDNDWYTSYQFLYRQDGSFSVWRGVNGRWVAIKPWTFSSSIVKNDWNTLKVIADSSQFRYYINDIQVWSGTDVSLISGQVGIWMYRESAVESLEVDWAKLGMSELYSTTRKVDNSQVVLTRQFTRFGKPLK